MCETISHCVLLNNIWVLDMQGICHHNTQRHKSSRKRFRAHQLFIYLPSHAQTLPPELRVSHVFHQDQRAPRTLVPLPDCNQIHCLQCKGLPCLFLTGFPGQPKPCLPKGRTLLQLSGSAALLFSLSRATNRDMKQFS